MRKPLQHDSRCGQFPIHGDTTTDIQSPQSLDLQRQLCLLSHLEGLRGLSSLVCLALRLLGDGVNETCNETGSNRGNGAEVDRVTEEDHAGCGDGELVEGADHAVCSRAGGSDTPCGRVGDEDGGSSGEGHGEQQEPSSFSRAVY